MTRPFLVSRTFDVAAPDLIARAMVEVLREPADVKPEKADATNAGTWGTSSLGRH
jgi:hypothetical protein